MASSTVNPQFFPINEAVYYLNGTVCCLCFLVGTFGNIVSFLYFKLKKRNISSVIYMLITANDIVVSITVLPVAISFFSKGKPGILFGNKYGCAAWENLWRIAIYYSVFLVLCLCVTRSISLLRPFLRHKIKYFLIAVLVMALVTTLSLTMFWNSSTGVKFDSSLIKTQDYMTWL